MKHFISIFLLMIFLTNCKEENLENNIQNEAIQIEFFKSKFDYFNNRYSDIDLNQYNINKYIHEESVVVNKVNFQYILKILIKRYDLELKEDETIINLLFYGNDLNLKVDKNITGFSIITKLDTGYFIKTYAITALNKIKLIKKLTQERKGFTISYYGFLSEKQNENNNSVFVIKKYSENYSQNRNNEAGIDIIVMEEIPIVLTKEEHNRVTCTVNECDTNGKGFCGAGSGSQVICQLSDYEDEICGDNEVGDPKNTSAEVPKVSAMYYIRNILFSSSNKGLQYIEYYYKMGYAFKSAKLFQQNNEELNTFSKLVRNKALLYFNGNDNQIIIDDSEAIYLLDLITKYKDEIDNLEYKDIFNTFEQDLNYIKNKSKLEIQAYLNN